MHQKLFVSVSTLVLLRLYLHMIKTWCERLMFSFKLPAVGKFLRCDPLSFHKESGVWWSMRPCRSRAARFL